MIQLQYQRRRREKIQAILFAYFLAVVFIVGLTVSVASAGPFVLGTELNGNGTVEYLCLGTGCETLATADW
jgi:hypothetical protein